MVLEDLKQKNNRYKLILIDYDMPGMNGIECAKELLLHYDKHEVSAPTIGILTAFNDITLKRQAIKLGVS